MKIFRIKAFIICAFLFMTISSFSQTKNLTTAEKKLISYIEDNKENSLQLLEKVINVNSGTMNLKGVKKVGQIFKKEFEKLGLETRWISLPKKMKRAGHVFAKTSGGQGKRILLIGHMDTVFEKNSPFQKYTQKGKYAYGPGINDMKGGIVVMIYALKALQAQGLLKNMQIQVAIMGDEEDTGKPWQISRKELIKAAQASDYVLGFEYGVDNINKATIARRGFSSWKLNVEGTRGHSSRIFSKEFGSGAIFAASDILMKFYNELKGEEYLTFNPGLVVGGSKTSLGSNKTSGTASGKTNVIARTAMVKGDLRTISVSQREKVKSKMKKIVATTLPGTKATLTFVDSYPPMPPQKGNYKLLSLLSQVSSDLGYGKVTALNPGKRGAADTSFVAPHASSIIDGLGLLGDGAHSHKERIDISEFPKIMKRSVLYLYRLSRTE